MKSPDETKNGLECCNKGNCKECPYRESEHIDCQEQMQNDALAYIQQLEEDRKERDILADAYQGLEAAHPKWISVEDEPKQTSDYLVYVWVAYPDGIAQMEMRKAIYNIVHKEWYVDCGRLEAVGKPTHWMHLPCAPKEEA